MAQGTREGEVVSMSRCGKDCTRLAVNRLERGRDPVCEGAWPDAPAVLGRGAGWGIESTTLGCHRDHYFRSPPR